MAVLMVLEIPGATIEQYDKVNDHMGVHGDEDAPEGLIQHVAGQDGDAVIVLDVWESEEALKRFFEERLGAALAAAGIDPQTAPPKIMPVHNTLQGKGADANVAVIIEVDDLGTDAYDEMVSSMDAHIGDGSDHPATSHTAARNNGGVLVVDVWESPESFGKFAEEQIGPAAAKVGMGQIEPRIIPIHNRISGRARVS